MSAFNFRFSTWLLCVLTLLATAVYAAPQAANLIQIYHPGARLLTSESGLSSNVVIAVTEDQFGRLWLGGQDGLNIVDGNHIRIINTENTNGNLRSNYISSMAADSQHTVWLATEKGLHKVDSRNYQTEQIALPVRPTRLALAQNSRYLAMLADSQLLLLDTHDEQLQPIDYFNDDVRAILPHGEALLALTSRQLFLYRPTEQPQPVGLDTALLQDMRFWSSDGSTLWFFTRSNKLFSCQPAQCQITERLLPTQLADPAVYALHANQGKLYLLTDKGLLVLGDEDELIQPQVALATQDKHHISPRLAVSRQGEVLITDYQGVMIIPAAYKQVAAFYTRPFGPVDSPQVTATLDNGTEGPLLAIATTNSLNLYKNTPLGPRISKQISYPQPMQPAILIPLSEQLLLSTKRHGVVSIDTRSAQVTSAQHLFPELPQNITLVDAIELPQQQLLLLYNNQLKLLQRQDNVYRLLWQHTLPVFATAKMLLLHDHLLIAAYGRGLISTRFNAEAPPQQWQQQLTDKTLINLLKSGPDSALLLTADSGLLKASSGPSGLTIEALPDQQKLLSKTIVCVTQNTADQTLAATHNGIAVFDKHNKLVRQLTASDGLVQREFDQYNCGKFGEQYYFAGNHGINLLTTDIQPRSSVARLNILSVSTEQGQVPFQDKQIRLVLPDYLSIHYSYAPTPLGAAVKFQYKLLPSHQSWQSSQDTSLHYPQLAPGRYQLQLQAVLADGSTSAMQQLDFQILPPWWQTPWAYLVYISLVLGIISYIWYNKYLVHRSRLALKQQQLQHQLAYTQTLEQEVQQRTAQTKQQQQQILDMTQQKLHLITAANHDLKHLAALIQLNAQSMALPAQYQQSAEWESILSGSQMLGQLVSDLVELSSLDAGQVRPELSALDLSALLNQLCQQFQPHLAAKQLQLIQDYPSAVCVLSDKALLSRLLINLFDNAVQNLSAEQQLQLSIEQHDDHCLLTLADTGPGLPTRIYQQWGAPFQRGTANYQGHGLGLSIVRKITEVLNLPTELHSSMNGTCFRFHFQTSSVAITPQAKKALLLDPDPLATTQIIQQLKQRNIDVATDTSLQPTTIKLDWLFIEACLLYPLTDTERVKLLASYQASRIVLMSANQADRQLARPTDYFLLKPLKASRLAWLFA